MTFTVIIPARYASTRLPGKALVDLCGKTLIERVHDRARQSGAAEVIIATDDRRIEAAATSFGANVVMTSHRHSTGTERLAEVVQLRGMADDAVIVNLQGDEPLMDGSVVRQVAALLEGDRDCVMATVCERILDAADVFDPNVVKVVMTSHGRALYFSRAPIPWARGHFGGTAVDALPPTQPYYRHIGLYAYRAGFLRDYAGWHPSQLEATEALEQLRVLQAGHAIAIAEACAPTGFGVDTPADVERVRHILAGSA
jgi:3-deoxy-manno-octulosonate cytidylyltransferase (CMP-KDO synthetase)